ncbi:NAD(P)H-dependent oxidoreductase [Lactococcus lactis subsp. lactis]|jgi:multimeric flavodoxin WrbA|uniref:NAD(P)H-dependent oxidoreductase n=1 Tax=Lactococcus lactis TaxID=1358 RepID=UPI001BAC0FEA|nr:NAD(P)H-dependent oxidoreductase [Lactococcus lactis]MDT3326398.1 NAD(P)H-dependent oxidoreductase [Bacillota bacterium]MBR8680108.1 NADPH-dependent oxidoreductase [Lactococcus lactis subsp. lactis]MBR8682468.1 NADPH-dependent oxidoreductase [Lactococcus lactis subsp. lactis]MBR8687538.1 NADPH-dependent oxidoreductase [Lactococcus lactis subsp. lactis]MBS3730468.1 NAD(P)H-dependent oxidoreductase [Lactococcus lactis subsp. lactis]
MKKIFVLIGSRNIKGNTIKFANNIVKSFKNECEVDIAFPQDFCLKPIDGTNLYFTDTSHNLNEDLKNLQKKIIQSDILIIGSPVYVHSMSADLKLIFENLSWWAHTLRLQGKPVVVISTCGSNGMNTVLEPVSDVISYMGGNIIATANASQIPDQINNEEWLDEVSLSISERIRKFLDLGAQSNKFLEKIFQASKNNILEQKKYQLKYDIDISKLGELKYWEKTGMINCTTFEEFLNTLNI